MRSESTFQPMELEQIHADISKLMAETMRINAEIRNPSRVRCLFHTVLVGSLLGTVGVTTGVVLAFLFKLH